MLKKILSIIMLIIVIFLNVSNNSVFANNNFSRNTPVKAAVFLINFTDDYISLVRKNLEDIQKENPQKIEFTFYDGQSNQAIQDEQIDEVLKKGVDLVLLHLINNRDKVAVETIINKFSQTNTPVILFNREPITLDPVKAYKKSLYIGLDAKQDGINQGKILVNTWNNNKAFIDKNNDDIMEYIVLKGEPDNLTAINRTNYCISTIEQAGIKTKQLSSVFAYWRRDLAKEAITSILLQYGDKIDAIIANDDSMALGAIDALQARGYNKGDKAKTIAVVGVEGLPEAQELIKKGMMLGTIFQDPKLLADALYKVGMNLVNNENPLEGTDYKLDNTGAAIRIPNKIIYES